MEVGPCVIINECLLCTQEAEVCTFYLCPDLGPSSRIVWPGLDLILVRSANMIHGPLCMDSCTCFRDLKFTALE